LVLPRLDASANNHLFLTFDVAYRNLRSTAGGYLARYHDTLEVHVSRDCGDTWETVWAKGGDDLRTTPTISDDGSPFDFPDSTQWRKDTVLLDTFAGEPNLRIRFECINGYGNNLFLDNIRADTIALKTNEPDTVDTTVSSRPDPLSGAEPSIRYDNQNTPELYLPLSQAANIEWRLLDLQGRLLSQPFTARLSGKEYSLDLNLPATPGVYLVQLLVDDRPYTLKALQAE